MAGTYLDTIAVAHRARAAADTRNWRDRLVSPYRGESFREALQSSNNVSVIAEIKRKSPSKGWLAENVDAPALAVVYAEAGARALSVLTDQVHFGARATDLHDVAAAVSTPRLRKDFTVSENDVLDAVEMGASAILLIAAMLTDDELVRFHELATLNGLDTLFEIHDEREGQRVLDCGATIVGINQRNLHTFDVDTDHAASVVQHLPASVLRVAESGLRTVEDVQRAAEAGFDAVLVGEVFVTASSPADLVRSFASVTRQQRG